MVPTVYSISGRVFVVTKVYAERHDGFVVIVSKKVVEVVTVDHAFVKLPVSTTL